MNVVFNTIVVAIALLSARAYASVFPIETAVTIDVDKPFHAKITTHFDLTPGQYCVFWPLNFPEKLNDDLPIKSLDLWYQRTAKTHLLSGRMRTLHISGNFLNLNEELPIYFSKFKKVGTAPVELVYTIDLPHHAFFTPNEIIYKNYLPVVSQNCSTETDKDLNVRLKTKVIAPKGWQVLSPFNAPTEGNETHLLNGFHSEFILGTGYKLESLQTESADIQLYYRTDEYKSLLPTIKKTLGFYHTNLGPLPTEKLIIFESDYTTAANTLGLIAYLKPRQEFLKSLQEYWLNWSEWAVTAALGYQWFGSLLEADHENHDWLTHSLRDYYVLKALKQEPHAYNVFNSYNHSIFGFKFTYSDFQDLTASSLNTTAPKARLTHDDLQTFVRLRHQNPLLFIRNVMTLRNLESIVGFRSLNSAVRSFYPIGSTPKKISPPDFARQILAGLRKTNPSSLTISERTLKEWWTKSGWPDRKLGEISLKNLSSGQQLVEFDVEEVGQLKVPSDIVVWDKSGKRYALPASTQDSLSRTYKIALDEELDRIEVDPERTVFDQNRFNNGSEWADFYFFPGNARELYQDAYTIFWFPYAVKRPGENIRLGVQSSTLKYLRGNYLISVETGENGKNTTLNFLNEQETNYPGLNYQFAVSKDYYDQRLAYLKLSLKDINSSVQFPLTLSFLTRAKQEGDDTNTQHGTLGLGAMILPSWRPEPCGFRMELESEQTPSEQGKDQLNYQRSFGTIAGLCNLTSQSQVQLRLFRGVTKSISNTPKNSYFWPQNLSEARIRFDFPPTEPHEWINSAGGDLLLPLYFPFEIGSYVLTKKIKLKLFYDYGEASRDTIYRSSGLGLIMPIGGDVVGAGSLSLTKLSFLYVVYQTVNDKKHPASFLFDITGEL